MNNNWRSAEETLAHISSTNPQPHPAQALVSIVPEARELARPEIRSGGRFMWIPFVCALALSTIATRAANMVLNYQASQWTGWQAPGNVNINTLGGNTSPLNFNDGTADGLTYQISLLPFGQAANPPDPVYEGAPANATINYKNTLNGAFGAVDAFNYVGGFAAANEFNVQSYSVSANNGGQVGADLYTVYNPGAGDPPINANLHWIQVFWNNWSSVGAGNTTGIIQNSVDNGGAANPYYDTKGAAGSTTIGGKQVFNFYDFPQRPSAELAGYNFNNGPIQWMAEDFLVADTGQQTVAGLEKINIYGGLEWGWQVTLVPEPSSLALAAIGGLFALVITRKARTSASARD
jgi:hypothetical protein